MNNLHRWLGAAPLMLLLAHAEQSAMAQATWPSYPNNGAISILPDGTVGIGTNFPSNPLHVKSTTNLAARFEGSTANGPAGSAFVIMRNLNSTQGNSSGIMTQNGAGAFNAWMDFINVNHNASGSQSGAISFSTTNAGSYGQRLYIKENGKVGIGTTNPLNNLEVWGPGSVPGLSPTSVGMLRLNSSSTQGLDIGALASSPYSVWMQAKTTNTAQGAAAYPLVLNPLGGFVGIGTNNPASALAVNGTVTAKEIVVTNTGWADFVFQPSYRLRPLSEVSKFIRANNHLPDIPSEAEVKAKGVSVGEMQAKLLAKIEELTLYMIQAEESNRHLQQRLIQLETSGRK